MLMDKGKAVRKSWRIPEWFLLTVALIGGSLGSLLGMYLFRHKTKKPASACIWCWFFILQDNENPP